MKTVTRQSTYEEVIKLPRAQPCKPRRPVFALRLLIRLPKPMNKYRDPKLNTPDKRRQK